MKNAQNSDNSNDNVKQRGSKRESTSNNSMNYLSLFQLNPLLMHAAMSSTTSPSKESPTGSKADENVFMNDVVEEKSSKSESNELYESVLEQKLLNDTLDMIQMIETSLTVPSHDLLNGTHETLSQNFLLSLTDDNLVQFKVQIPNLLPKMHFVCEIGSRVLFKTIDWLRDLQVFQFLSTDTQSEILKSNWIDLLIIGIGQICIKQNLKHLIISTLVNYMKSIIIKDDEKMKGRKMKKMMSNIMMLNKFIDNLSALDLDNIEFAHLRLISFFNPNKIYLSSDARVKKYQEKIVENLKNYLKSSVNYVAEERLISIFQSLSMLPSFDVKIIEKLFFNILVDFIRIDSIIPYIVNLNTGDYKQEYKMEKDLDINDENSPSNNSDDQRYYSDGLEDKS